MVGMSLRTSFTTKSTTDQEVYIKVPYQIKYTISGLTATKNQTRNASDVLSFISFMRSVVQGIEPAKSRTRLVFTRKTILRKPLDILVDPSLINKPDKDLLGQYYLLKSALQDYRNIEKRRLESLL
jgi:hypothetical protein